VETVATDPVHEFASVDDPVLLQVIPEALSVSEAVISGVALSASGRIQGAARVAFESRVDGEKAISNTAFKRRA
jgi:hypothetical protein